MPLNSLQIVDKITEELLSYRPISLARFVVETLTPSDRNPARCYEYKSAPYPITVHTALAAVAEVVQPKSYLEIGVRRGHSMAIVLKSVDESSYPCLIGVDPWLENYSDEPNGNPEFVMDELCKIRNKNKFMAKFHSLESHLALPEIFKSCPKFDLVLVDGDHSEEGARRDLNAVVDKTDFIVFDDICHPAHMYLKRVWEETISSTELFYTIMSYDHCGVAIAIRKTATLR